MTERTAVYRLRDAAGVLLYVGVSNRYERRWMEHSSSQPWWGDVVRFEVVWFADRASALRAESAAIVDESPLHNIARPAAAHAFTSPPRDVKKVRSVRIKRWPWDDAKAKAAAEGRTISEVVERALHRYMNEKQRPPRPRS